MMRQTYSPPLLRFLLPVAFLAFLFCTGFRTLEASEALAKPDPEGRRPPKLPYAEEVPSTPFDAPPGTFTVAVLPDTQYYAKFFPEVFQRQTEWIAKNKEAHDIRFVLHEGDITDNNLPEQWEVAQKAMNVLTAAKIPYVLSTGNHDTGSQRGGNTSDRETDMNQYFSESDYQYSKAVGYFEPGRLENTWHEFDTPWGPFLVVALEFGPRNEVLEWANRVVADHPDHRVIVLTHSYLSARGGRTESAAHYPFAKKEHVNGGQAIWDKFVSQHPGMRLVLAGHVIGTAYRKDAGAGGTMVHQMLADYQSSPTDRYGPGIIPKDRSWGGGGYLRLLQFLPDGHTVRVKTYSPWYDEWWEEPNQQFDIHVE